MALLSRQMALRRLAASLGSKGSSLAAHNGLRVSNKQVTGMGARRAFQTRGLASCSSSFDSVSGMDRRQRQRPSLLPPSSPSSPLALGTRLGRRWFSDSTTSATGSAAKAKAAASKDDGGNKDGNEAGGAAGEDADSPAASAGSRYRTMEEDKKEEVPYHERSLEEGVVTMEDGWVMDERFGEKPPLRADGSPGTSPWRKYLEGDTGNVYYYNTETNLTSWKHPTYEDDGSLVWELPLRERLQPGTVADVETRPELRPPAWRLAAAMAVDAGLSLGFGLACGAIMFTEIDDPEAAGQGMGLATWLYFVTRESVWEEGTRSVGKRLLKLEVVQRDGTFASRTRLAWRNAYFLVFPTLTPLIGPGVLLVPIVDLLTMAASKYLISRGGSKVDDWRSLGDWYSGTRVIMEQPGREERVATHGRIEELKG